jgi:hypothetical protein
MKWHQRLSKEELGVLSKERLLNLFSHSLDDDEEAAPDDDGYCVCATTHLKRVVAFFLLQYLTCNYREETKKESS